MEIHSYWHKQTADKPLFPDIEWNKPEQRSLAGRLAVIGGNKLGFAAAALSYSEALKSGVGECRVVLPDALKKAVPTAITDTVFVPTNQSGGINKDAESELLGVASWASGLLLIGDAGRNSETAIVYETLLQKYSGQAVITRDAVDLLRANAQLLVDRPDTMLVISFAQLQKLFQAVYYPKTLLFKMQLLNFVEALHKFTITYPVTIVVLHQEQLLVASGGEVTTTPWGNPMAIWRGSVATKAAAYWLWSPTKPLEAATASLLF
jgi:ADP-dependent NAD(P)H-hydrate dehydratase / NAD(P)H-hydrate epimerase